VLTVSVGERPEGPDREQSAPPGRGNGRSAGSARGKRGRPRRTAATIEEIEEAEVAPSRGEGGGSAGNGGGNGGAGDRERMLRRLLAGLRAVDAGDFTARVEPAGDPLMEELAELFNSVITKQDRLSDELNRVALSVGREGKMRDRATIGPAGGQWAGSVDALNSLITDLVQPTSEVARVIKAVAEGDLSQKVEMEIEGKTVQGEFFRIGSTVNRMVDQLNAFASEVTRVAREVGTEGRLGGQANVQGVSGTWRDLTDSVNGMATNLTNQVRNIADVTTAVAKGDLSKKITAEAKGEILELKNTINTMVDQLSSFADEVTRVAREVGTEGVLGGQANVPGVAGTWKDLTDSVNGMASNLTNQVRNIADVTTAVAKGDLGRKITVEAKGEVLELKNTVNTMVDQLNAFAAEVTRVSREVGTEGILGGQANVPGVAGTWKDLTDSVNFMASNLTSQVRNIADVTTAVARGDLSRKITAEAKGEMLELKNTVNTMVDQLNGFAAEVTRVAREVGTDGKLGGQAEVPGVAGTWKDLTDSVNGMATNLTNQVRNIADVTTAVAKGDLSKKITAEAKGEILELKNTINTMVDQLSSFAAEVTRVAREVGTEGILGGQADVPGVAGTWKDLTDSVNFMAGNLTNQVRNIALVTTAVANGDLSQKITVEAKGEILELKNTINIMVDQLSGFAAEVTRVAREVGTEGILGGQANVPGVAGTWKDLTDSVNFMAGNLTSQVRNIALVTTAVANGDLSQKITVEAKGEMLELKNTVNTMVDQLNSFAAEVTRVAREVGSEGRLGGQANVPGVAGTWKDLTDSVNFMAGNLTSQVRNIADVTTAVARGDLSKKITAEAKGEILELKTIINTMVDQLNAFAAEVTRVSREVGTEGRLGGQANVEGVSGTWRDLTDSVNSMASNLTSQVRNIADVTTAVAKGDLSRKITAEAKGEVLELKNTVNTMVDQLNSFAAEVTRVAREVGTEGVLGGQANVPGVAGTWKDLTDSVNGMASNLTSQVRNIADVTTAVAKGDLSKKITAEAKGEMLELKTTVNTMVDQLRSFADEVTRVAREVGTEGRLGGQANVPGVAGTWKDLTDSVNYMASNLTAQVRNIADVTTAVALGDLSRKITVDARGEILELKNTVNTMVEQLNAFASEVTRVAREVGSEGILGGQARVPGAGGVWRDLTDNVNFMASNLTSQVRNIALVTTAVANGDLSQKITVEARGEILELKNTVNTMVEKLRVFADEVTRVAKEVGTEGKLGGQAEVPGVAGTWKGLTDSVNAMANSLTAQVRNIADVATAVTKGDLTRQITVEAQGELDELKANINQMIGNLKETTERNQEQDWLKTNLAKFSRMMQGQKDLESVSRLIMSELTPLVSAHHGAFFILDMDAGAPILRLIASYAYRARKHVGNRFAIGEGLVGQAALEKQPILLQNVPDDYIQITSGLGEAPPRNIIVLPVLFEGEVKAVIELASFLPFSQIHQTFLDQLAESIGVVLNMIGASMRTEELLEQSQKLTQELQTQSRELQSQQDELKRSNSELEAQAKTLRQSEELLKEQQEELQQVNEELEEKASLLAEQNQKVEQKNREVEAARLALEEKAEQLALSSKYKSEFLANMSHELRTPLNSLLILAKLLADNKDKNLTAKQVEFAQTIHSSGTDLLNLINDILDLSKVEAGKMEVNPVDVPIDDIGSFTHRTFDVVAQQKGITFTVEILPEVPPAIYTDGQRLQQVIKNLLSNAFKFTAQGGVTLTVRKAEKGKRFASRILDQADTVLAFAVSDTGIGIAKEKQQLIFEAFQQADGTTSRKFGGTGLGLSISREIARLLGGEIRVESAMSHGSTFTLFLPARYVEPEGSRAGSEGSRAGTEESSSRRRDRGETWGKGGDESGATRRPGGTSRPMDAGARSASLSTAESGGWEQSGGGSAVATTPDGGEYGAPLERDELPRPTGFDDDRDEIEDGDRVLLIIENDVSFSRILLDMAREKGFRGLCALDGAAGLKLAHAFKPDAITLDIDMPGMDGWAVLDRLKHHPQTRHIPVHIITGVSEKQQGLKNGALAYLEKPVTRETLDESFAKISSFIDTSVKRLLVVEDDETQRQSMIELIQHEDVEITAVSSAEDALRELSSGHFDCMVLDLGLRDMNGFELLETVKANPQMWELPIIIYTGKDLSQAEETKLRKFAETIIVKDVKSPERLLDETALFLHRVEAKLPEQKRRMLERLHNADAVFADKRVLIVDDDVRNIFSLTSMLEDHGMQVSFAENGKDAIGLLRERQDFDLVLMDVMMPEMDGYETTRAIRQVPALKALPIIALTAKAMKGDREKCIAAGASDYITKPVDTEQLLSLMRVWLYR
jgi:HAMP domain-containing protein/CheY-like chemotaxis protein/signal transduction histidine kinase